MEVRSWFAKLKSAWVITLSKIGESKILNHLHIIGRGSTKFQVNLMKDVRGVAETRYLGRTDGRNTEEYRWMRVISIVPLPLRRVTKKTFRIDEIGIIRNEFVCAGGWILMSKHWQTGKYLTNLTYRKNLKILKVWDTSNNCHN